MEPVVSLSAFWVAQEGSVAQASAMQAAICHCRRFADMDCNAVIVATRGASRAVRRSILGVALSRSKQ